MSYLLDTNVVSEMRKRRPDPNVVAWFGQVSAADLFVSVLTLGEIRRGIELLRRRDAMQAEAIENWLSGLLDSFGDRVADVDARVTDLWGRMNAPNPMPVVDGLLAATAKAHGWTLVTPNVIDFPAGVVPVLNPFESTS